MTGRSEIEELTIDAYCALKFDSVVKTVPQKIRYAKYLVRQRLLQETKVLLKDIFKGKSYR